MKLPNFILAVLACAGVLVLAWVDWRTGRDLNFFIFYFAPVSAAAWYLGLRTSVLLSLLSATVWYLANDMGGLPDTARFYAIWNTGIRLVSFLCIGFSIARMRQALDQEQAIAGALRKALSDIRVLEAVLPVCAQCKKIRNDEGTWEAMEAYISTRSDTRFSHGYCPECEKNVREAAGLAPREPKAGE